jgi:hypothetical protein
MLTSRLKSKAVFKKGGCQMKKIGISFIVALIFLLLTGCNSNHDTYTVKNGTYIMDQESTEKIFIPQITISDDTISFSFDPLSSYWPRGNFTIKDDILTMTTNDNMYNYVFQIDGGDLVFQKDESSLVRLIDSRLGISVMDQSKFHLEDE